MLPVDKMSAGQSDIGGLARAVHKSKNLLCAVYDYSKLGGAVGDISLVDDYGDPAVLPDNAVVDKVIIDVLTAPTSGGAATVALKSEAAGDLLAATAIAGITGIIDGVPNGAAANAKKMSADRRVTATVAVAALTAGKFRVMIEYSQSE